MRSITIGFYEGHDFDETSIRLVQGTIGLYFIYLMDLKIPYPFQSSRLIYIGMSESKQNSIGNRLRDHKTGQSGNAAIMNYSKRYEVSFTCHSQQILETLGSKNVLELESYFLVDFLSNFGSYPICNNQSGTSFPGSTLNPESARINWAFFS
jgi:hypothetical protein